jgi:hypothetical protein
VSVIVGCRPVSAMSADSPDGDAPYSTIPGRTQSKCVSGCHSTAAEFARLRAPAMFRAALERRELLGDAALGVGIRKMRHQRDLADRRARARTLPCGAVFSGW